MLFRSHTGLTIERSGSAGPRSAAEGRRGDSIDDCDRTGLTLPVVEYPHSQGCSVTGGFVYRGKALPRLAGVYFYADFCTGLVRSFRWTRGYVRDHWDWKFDVQNISSFGTDEAGELYIVSLDGEIYRLSAR